MSKFQVGDVVRFDFKQFSSHKSAVELHSLNKSFQFIVKNADNAIVQFYDFSKYYDGWRPGVLVKVEPRYPFPFGHF